MNKLITVTGWNPGFNKIACDQLIQKYLGLNLKEAKQYTDKILHNPPLLMMLSDQQQADNFRTEMLAQGTTIANSQNPASAIHLPSYIQLTPGSVLPDISLLKPFRCVVVIEEDVTVQWQNDVSNWLVDSGCLYMMAWGKQCSSWDDSVDYANIEQFLYEDIPDECAVMTTWHEHEPLVETFWFAKYSAHHSSIELPELLILHITSNNQKARLVSLYLNA